MKPPVTNMVDDHLKALTGMQEAETDPFFYTRLKARMENRQMQQGWNFPVKPVWLISTLLLLLIINGFVITQQFKTKNTAVTTGSSLQSFAASYDQTVSTNY